MCLQGKFTQQVSDVNVLSRTLPAQVSLLSPLSALLLRVTCIMALCPLISPTAPSLSLNVFFLPPAYGSSSLLYLCLVMRWACSSEEQTEWLPMLAMKPWVLILFTAFIFPFRESLTLEPSRLAQHLWDGAHSSDRWIIIQAFSPEIPWEEHLRLAPHIQAATGVNSQLCFHLLGKCFLQMLMTVLQKPHSSVSYQWFMPVPRC